MQLLCQCAVRTFELLDHLFECLDLLAGQFVALVLRHFTLNFSMHSFSLADPFNLLDQSVVFVLQTAHLVVVSLKDVLKF